MSMADFEKIEIDPTSSEARYERPDFAKVIFQNIAETYPTDAHVECKYIITSSLVPTSRDWVGLYKVGWSNSRDYVYFLWSPMPAVYQNGTEVENHVLFQAHSLPKDDGEFYQFCYVSSTGHVRGASTPFQFKRPSADDFVEIEDLDSDMMVIKTKSKALEESLAAAMEEKEELTKKVMCLEQERESLVKKLVATSKEVTSERRMKEEALTQLKEIEDKIPSLQTEVKDMTMAHDGLREKIILLNQEKQVIEKRLDENDKYIHSLQDKIKALISEKDNLTGRNKALEQEKELLKNHFSTSENQVKGYLTEITNLRSTLTELESELKNTKSVKECELEDLLADMAMQKDTCKALEECAERHTREKEELCEKLRNAEDKLAAGERRKQILRDEVNAVNQAHLKISSDLEKAKSESHELQRQLSREEKQFKEDELVWKQEIDALKIALDSKDQELHRNMSELKALRETLKKSSEQKEAEKEGSLYALQMAQQHLKDRYAKIKSRNEELQRQIEDLLEQQKKQNDLEHDSQREVQDLKERLTMGAEEYKVKYLECRKLQTELKKIQKRGSKSPSPEKVVPEKAACVQTEMVQKSEANTNTETVDPEEKCESESQTESTADLSSGDLQTQLDDLGRELQQRYAKKQKYKQLFQEEKDKGILLQKLYHEELAKKEEELKNKEEEIKQLRRRLRDEEDKAKKHIQELQHTIEKQITELRNIRDTSPDQTNEEEAGAAAAVVMEMDPLVTGEAPAELEPPLTPLPPPIQPEVLNTAKVAAVQAINAGYKCGESDDSQSEDLDDVTIEKMLVLTEDDQPEEDRFHDADGEPQKLCPVCNTTFPADLPQGQFEDHVDSHYGPVCPMCQLQFPIGCEQGTFETHVNEHFSDNN